jgi:hypothetical protein
MIKELLLEIWMKLLLSKNEARKTLGVGPATLRILLEERKIRTINVVGTEKIPLKELHRFIDDELSATDKRYNGSDLTFNDLSIS